MLFNSVHFLLFFPIVALVYFVLPQRARWMWLLVASYYFYMSWNPKYALLIAFSTLVTYASGLLIARSPGRRAKRLWVGLSFGINLAILFFFKYFGFALANLNRLLAAAGIQMLEPAFDVLLPVGISFYTFQALSYTVDVYRGEVPAERNLGKYALFVSFFPQLVAGPIERSKNLLAQVHQPHFFEYQRVKNGLLLMLWGYFEKMVLADRAAILVDHVLGNHQSYAGPQIITAVLLFAVQIYGDFAGYSHIAIGAAELLGFDLMRNFRQPYFAASVREFWQRWHISLSSWFRDYLYIPLGGNRKGRLRRWLNLMLTFLLSGLWHGANWTFVFWGGLHGLYQIIGDATRPLKDKLYARLPRGRQGRLARAGQLVVTFLLVDFAWILFRAPGMRAFLEMVRSIFDFSALADFSLTGMGLSAYDLAILGVAILILFGVDFVANRQAVPALLARQPVPLRWAAYYLLLYLVLRFGVYGTGYTPPQFIYFQF